MRKQVLALSLILAACSAAAQKPLPLETFFKHAEFSSMVISPTGEYLAATAPGEGRTGVVILDISEYPEVRATTSFAFGEDEHATNLTWASDERLVFTTNRQVGDLARPQGTGRVWATNADGSMQMQVYGPRPGESMVGRFANIIHRLPDDSRRVLISEWAHDRPKPHALLVDLDRYQRTSRVTVSPLDRGGLAADQDGNVRFAFGFDDDLDQKFAWRPDSDSDWEMMENPFGGEIEPWGATADGNHFYVKSRDQEDMGVYKVELGTGEYEPILTDDTFEALSPIWDASGENLIGAIFNTPVPEARFIDPNHPTARIWRSLQAALPDYQVRLSGFTDDESRAVVQLYSDREPGVFMLLDAENMSLNELAPTRSWVPVDRMGEMRPVTVTARDGLELYGYLTVPPGVDEPERLPMIVEVHGGPHGPFDQWGWNPYVQTWASRGYAVLQINYRGSGGYGYQFERDAYGMWGVEMQDDVTDATRWAIEEGIAHPDRICISGGSYGGYAAMMGVIREPDLYQCAFAFVGVYDLELMKKEGDIPETEMGRRYLDRALGTDTEVLRERSPVHHVDQIKADLFVAHGAEDIRAHYKNYHVLIEALEKAGIPHEKMWVEGEGHGFYEVKNNTRLFSRVLEFFDRNIGSGWSGDESLTAE